MFGLKGVYFYLVAYQITLIKFFKKLYFSSKNYNKSLVTMTPRQIYYNPNPFLLSIIAPSNDQTFKINKIEALVKTNSKNALNLVSDFVVNYQ